MTSIATIHRQARSDRARELAQQWTANAPGYTREELHRSYALRASVVRHCMSSALLFAATIRAIAALPYSDSENMAHVLQLCNAVEGA